MSAKPFKEVTPTLNPKLEEGALGFWRDHGIFRKSIENRRGREPFVFIEGPPTANGLPHLGHISTRAVKDLVLRYKTMQGYYVERKGGWDTHGLPVETEVEKELGISSKKEIEEYGIEKFNHQSKKSVFRYEKEWKRATERLGFWIDMDHPYVTYENEYIESVWWSIRKIWDRNLIYRSHKVVPYCPRCETPLSSHEVSQGYAEITDPSIFVKFPLSDNTYILAWTTTPWTLLGNLALAVHPEHRYVVVDHRNENLILAEDCLAVLDGDYEILRKFKGKELEKKRYKPVFEYVHTENSHIIVTADWVTLDEGTGVVHIAPAFGEEDYAICREYGIGFAQPVASDGRFTDDVPILKGVFVKDADQRIISILEQKSLLYRETKYKHTYPFCWRCKSPLLYYARNSWFISMRSLKEDLLRNNEEVKWYPDHLKHGRFGVFLENVEDWALSRERYWGTPLPIWICESCGLEHCVGSIDELMRMANQKPEVEVLDLHRPYVDEITLRCPKCKGSMHRVSDVIDCWYDSGAAPFAQWHYPFENAEKFETHFPASFITEAIDQTRGWFYSLLAISTAVFGQHPYKHVLSIGHILDVNGVKMSKSKGNVIDPWTIFNEEGADCLRWYLYSASAPWEDVRFYEDAIIQKNKFLNTLWNSYFFFVTYANIDKFDPSQIKISLSERPTLDRWLISRLNSITRSVRRYLDEYEIHKATHALEDFVMNDLSNWYIRCSRRRFWTPKESIEKNCGYLTLYETLVTLIKLLAPFVPFVTELIHQNLVGSDSDSVHLCNYPYADISCTNKELEESMELTREIIKAGRSIRSSAGIKARQPLKQAILVCSTESKINEHLDLIKDELNVKHIRTIPDESEMLSTQIKPKYEVLGPKYKGKAPKIASIIEEKQSLNIEVEGETIEIKPEEIEIIRRTKEGFARAEAGGATLFIDTRLTPSLVKEGLARDIVRRIQDMRKDLDLEYTARIRIYYLGDNVIRGAIEEFEGYIAEETLADIIEEGKGGYEKKWTINGKEIYLGIDKI